MAESPKKTSRFAEKLARSLWSDAALQERFTSSLVEGKREYQAILWLQKQQEIFPSVKVSFSWLSQRVQVIESEATPGKHLLHTEGAYYCLDLSSVFCASVLDSISFERPTILDLCASPGGKSIYTWKQHSPELLIANEVMQKRVPALLSNFKRCKISGAIVTGDDSQRFAERAPQSCEIVIVDAPCSGQSLLARGIESPGCFHPATINLNANRQKRILSNGAAVVAPGGYLAYMTCTYSREENEKVIEWFCKRNQDFKTVEVMSHQEYRSPYTQLPCYRIFPWQGGSGGFVALLQREGERQEVHFPDESFRVFWSSR